MSLERSKKKLLIIKSTNNGLISVETFLKNREWEMTSTSNLKEALIFLVQHQPEFVMISVDHPNKKVRNLPKVLAQAFPVCVIAFTEDSSAAAHKLLNNCATKYMLYPPVTGPAVERTVNRYYKDLQGEGFATSAQAFEAKASARMEAMIAIRGEGAAPLSTENMLASLFSEEGDSILQPGVNVKAHSAADGHGAGQAHFAHQEGQAAKNHGSVWGPIEQNKYNQRTGLSAEHLHADPRSNKSDSLLFRGSKEALEKSSIRGLSKDKIENSEKPQSAACLLIESSRFAGYLITVGPEGLQNDEAFLLQLRSRLFSFLRSNGETVADNDTMDVKLKPVPFEDWALEQADFLRKSSHRGQDVAMAFFPRPNTAQNFIESDDKKMFLVPLSELKADTAVEFNLYVHLPKNNKYVLYTPRGTIFYGKQKDRLEQQGVSKLHILKEDVRGLEKYRAQNYLNEKIDQYQEHKKTELA